MKRKDKPSERGPRLVVQAEDPEPDPPVGALPFRDRVSKLIRIRPRDLKDNAGNWRKHPEFQRRALKGMLQEVGIAGALLAYSSQRNDGALTLIDGHLRKDLSLDVPVPVLVLDVTDDEADKLLATIDPIAELATAAQEDLRALLGRIQPVNADVKELLEKIRERNLFAHGEIEIEQPGVEGFADDPQFKEVLTHAVVIKVGKGKAEEEEFKNELTAFCERHGLEFRIKPL